MACERKEVKYLADGTTFKFDAGNKIQSDEGMEVPCIISGQKINLRIEVVKSSVTRYEENGIQIKYNKWHIGSQWKIFWIAYIF